MTRLLRAAGAPSKGIACRTLGEATTSSTCAGPSALSLGKGYAVGGGGATFSFAHAALDAEVEVEQLPSINAAGHEQADGTGDRLWPTCVALCRYLCAHPQLVRRA